MKNRIRICIAVGLFAAFAGLLIMGENVMAQSVIYGVKTSGGRKISVIRAEDGLRLRIDGADGKTLSLRATGGGVSACRTIIEHDSGEANVVLSLAIPSPRARCRALPGSVTVESSDQNWALDESTVRRTIGGDTKLRSVVKSLFGTIDEGGL